MILYFYVKVKIIYNTALNDWYFLLDMLLLLLMHVSSRLSWICISKFIRVMVTWYCNFITIPCLLVNWINYYKTFQIKPTLYGTGQPAMWVSVSHFISLLGTILVSIFAYYTYLWSTSTTSTLLSSSSNLLLFLLDFY